MAQREIVITLTSTDKRAIAREFENLQEYVHVTREAVEDVTIRMRLADTGARHE